MNTMMYGYGWHMGWYWFSMIGLWVVLVGVVYLLVTRRRPPRSDHWAEVQQTLDRGLASGEMDEADYQRLRDLISDHHRRAETTSTSASR
jgi:uncharacterized membrane protein